MPAYWSGSDDSHLMLLDGLHERVAGFTHKDAVPRNQYRALSLADHVDCLPDLHGTGTSPGFRPIMLLGVETIEFGRIGKALHDYLDGKIQMHHVRHARFQIAERI